MDYITLGRNIKKYRKYRNLTQEQLAETVSISAVFMSQIENANGKPSLETVVNIANALNVSIDVLVGSKIANNEIAQYIAAPLTNEQLNVLSLAFNRRSADEIAALLKAFTYLLDIQKNTT